MNSAAQALPLAPAFEHATHALTDEQRYRGIFDHAIDGIFQTTPEGRYIRANPALARIYGYESARKMVEELFDIGQQLYIRPERREEFLREMEAHGRVSDFESEVYRRDGSAIWISENAVAVRNGAGLLLYYEGFVVDITRRRAAQEDLQKTRADLERSLEELRATQQQMVQTERLRAIGEMVKGIAHDFSNTLSLIVGYGEMLQRKCRQPEFGQECAEYSQIIITAALDAAESVHRLRDFHRPAKPNERRPGLSLNSAVEQAIAFSRPRWEAESSGRGAPVEIKKTLNDVPTITGNGGELREMLVNLIFNAVDAMPQGGVLTISTNTAGDRVELTVADSGIGMTDEVRRRCIEPYFTTKGLRGMGLGLAKVFGAVERHEGAMKIVSAQGRGTTFTFSFPADRLKIAGGHSGEKAARSPLRILVVDDQAVQAELLAHALEREWHTVTVAANGREALEQFERREFDLVITDNVMPEINGDQLAVAVKSREPDTRIIMLTGFGSADESAGYTGEFIDRVLVKPVAFADLKKAITSVMAG